ncbi:MAG: peptidyl-prolyl cis-trans isomerase B (cyclophilin B), partial [Myxococcota bacterium]
SATALAAMRVPDRARAMDPAQPAQVRAALVAALPTAELLTLAVEDAEPAVRTAAAATLLERGESSARSGAALVGADDPLVREVGVDLLLRGGDPDASAAGLLRVLADESDEGVLRATFAGLDQLAASAPKAVDQGRRAITTALTTLPPDISARLRSAARGLSRRLKLEWDEPPPSGPSTTTLQLDGREVEIEVGAPTLDDVGSIQLARVQTTRGAFTIALDPTTAPYAVANFARLSEVGWYDDLVFHRVVPGFVVQTGCPRGDGWGGPGWTVPDEVSLGGFGTGSVGMARAEPDSGGSQWFVTLSPQPHLDGDYTRFGQVVQGLHVVRGLERGDRVLAVTIERAR